MGEPLEKALWTDAYFGAMGWHDATVHAIAFREGDEQGELALDLDYIVRWIEPKPPSKNFSFLVAPATLVFDNVWSLDGELGGHRTQLEIADLHRLEPDGERQRRAGVRPWKIEGHDFELRFLAAGFRQHFRCRPLPDDLPKTLGSTAWRDLVRRADGLSRRVVSGWRD